MTTRSLRGRARRSGAVRASAIWLVAWLALPAVQAQQAAPLTNYRGSDAPEWSEDDVPPPPAYKTSGLVPIEMPPSSTVHMGLDPATLSINVKSGVVRYVVVAQGPSATNAFYEGIRCSTGEYRVYARQTPGQAWSPSPEARWDVLRGRPASRHALQLARDGICVGTAMNDSVDDMLRALRSPKGTLYQD